MDFVFDPSLVLYLPLYQLDGASFVSKDAHGHLCSVTGALWRPNGRYFDGTDDYMSIPDHNSLDFGTGDFSCETWVDTADISSGAGASCFFLNKERNAGNYQGFGARFAVADGYLHAYITGDDGNFVAISHAKDYRATGRHHFFMVVDRSSASGFKLFMDAEEVASGDPTSITTITNTALLYIGVYRDGSSHPYSGIIGEVRIYSRAFAPPEIQCNYLATKWRYR